MDFKSFYEKYFLLNLKDYPNIGIDLEINKILFCIILGIIAASFIINFIRGTCKSVITKLTRHNSYAEDSAKTLGELKINSPLTRYILKTNKRLLSIIKRVGEKSYTYEEYVAMTKEKGYKEEKIDFETARFYIAEDKRDEAAGILNMKDTSFLSTVLFALLLLSMFVCLMFLMPEILPFINNLLEK